MQVVREKLYRNLHQEVPYNARVMPVSFKTLTDGSWRFEQNIVVPTNHVSPPMQFVVIMRSIWFNACIIATPDICVSNALGMCLEVLWCVLVLWNVLASGKTAWVIRTRLALHACVCFSLKLGLT